MATNAGDKRAHAARAPLIAPPSRADTERIDGAVYVYDGRGSAEGEGVEWEGREVDGDGDGEEEQEEEVLDETRLSSPGAFVWCLTLCAGVSGLLFGFEYVFPCLFVCFLGV